MGYSGLVLRSHTFNRFGTLSRPANLRITDIRGCTDTGCMIKIYGDHIKQLTIRENKNNKSYEEILTFHNSH